VIFIANRRYLDDQPISLKGTAQWLILVFYDPATGSKDTIFPANFQFLYLPCGISSCFGLILKATTTYQMLALGAGIRENLMNVVGHNFGCTAKIGKLIRSLEHKRNWRCKGLVRDFLSKQLLVNPWNVSFRIRFDANFKHNFMMLWILSRLTSRVQLDSSPVLLRTLIIGQSPMLPINRSVMVPLSVCSGKAPPAMRSHHSGDPNRPSVGSMPKSSVV
jgi:hypothetical protein